MGAPAPPADRWKTAETENDATPPDIPGNVAAVTVIDAGDTDSSPTSCWLSEHTTTTISPSAGACEKAKLKLADGRASDTTSVEAVRPPGGAADGAVGGAETDGDGARPAPSTDAAPASLDAR